MQDDRIAAIPYSLGRADVTLRHAKGKITENTVYACALLSILLSNLPNAAIEYWISLSLLCCHFEFGAVVRILTSSSERGVSLNSWLQNFSGILARKT